MKRPVNFPAFSALLSLALALAACQPRGSTATVQPVERVPSPTSAPVVKARVAPKWEVRAAPTALPAQPGDSAPRQSGILLFTSTPRPRLVVTPGVTETSEIQASPTVEERQVIRVMWDTSHGPRQGQDGAYTVAGIYHDLAQLLVDENIYLFDDDQALPRCDVGGYSAIVLAATSVYSAAITPDEAECIWQFVQDGGGLVILAERPGFPNQLLAATDAFGAQAFLDPEISDAVNCSDHPICAGIGGITFYQGGALSGSPDWVAAEAGGSPAVLARADLPGCVVIIGDSNLFDNRWLPPNKAFAVNVFRWAAR